MDALPYTDALIREYLLWRGLTSACSAFAADLAADQGCGFQPERLTALLFRQLIPGLDARALVDFLDYLNMGLLSRLDSRHERLAAAVEGDVLRLFLVTAARARAHEAMSEFFKLYGPQLLASSAAAADGGGGAAGWQDGSPPGCDWQEWFVLPYLAHPEREPRFQVYFSPEWASLLEVSFRNFIAGVVASLPLPAVLRFNTDRRLRLALQQQVSALQAELDGTKQHLAEALAELQEQKQQHQQQQAQPPPPQQQQQQHKREASLGDWQHHHHSHDQQQLHPDGPLQPPDEAGEEGATAEDSEPQVLGGSGLFDLLPQHSAAQAAAAAAAAAAGGGLPDTAALTAATPGDTEASGQPLQQQQQHHARGSSFSGSISFDAAGAGPAAVGRAAAVDGGGYVTSDDEAGMRQAPPSGAASPELQPPQAAAGARGARGSGSTPLSTSPVMSWAGGSSSSTGARARHLPPPAAAILSGFTLPGAADAGPGTAAATAASAAVPPVPVQALQLVAAPPSGSDSAAPEVTCQQHAAVPTEAAGAGAGVRAVAFSPTGANVASVLGPSGVVAIWAPNNGRLAGNAGRATLIPCKPVSCVCWDSRADKLMLIGCGGGGGVRAWHADTRRVMATITCEPGFPAVAALAACPSEPVFAVASNSSSSGVATAGLSQQQEQQAGVLHGRLVTYNARSFKRSAVLLLPGDVGLASLAYSSSGTQLLVGSLCGTALLYEPGSRSNPLRAWHVAAAVTARPASSSSSSVAAADGASGGAVQVLWRPLVAAGQGGTAITTTSSAGGMLASSSAGDGSMLTLCGGVLCEWLLAPSSKQPVAALDVLGAAVEALQDGDGSSSSSSTGPETRAGWHCAAAVSPDGGRVAVLCCDAAAGVLLLVSASGGGDSEEPGSSRWSSSARVLMRGPELAGGCGGVSWHAGGSVVACGTDGHSSSYLVTVAAAV